MRKPDTTEIAELYRKGEMSQEEIGAIYGIGRKAVNNRLRSIGIFRRAPKSTRIKKSVLERIYSKKRLPVEQILEILGCSFETLQEALVFHGIPEREKVKKRGKYDHLLENLKVGKTKKITLDINHPHIALHKTAKGLGIKISMRATGENTFAVTRIK